MLSKWRKIWVVLNNFGFYWWNMKYTCVDFLHSWCAFKQAQHICLSADCSWGTEWILFVLLLFIFVLAKLGIRFFQPTDFSLTLILNALWSNFNWSLWRIMKRRSFLLALRLSHRSVLVLVFLGTSYLLNVENRTKFCILFSIQIFFRGRG